MSKPLERAGERPARAPAPRPARDVFITLLRDVERGDFISSRHPNKQ